MVVHFDFLSDDLLLSYPGFLDVSVSSQCGKGDSALGEQVLGFIS